jgi:TonB-linked SusC/RagA family outer membrane protein
MKNQFDPVNAGLLTKQKKIFLWIKMKSIFFFVALFSISTFGRTLTNPLKLEKVILMERSNKMNKERYPTLPKRDNIITGKVAGELGESLYGATVKVKGSSIQVTTGVDGSFSIAAKESDVLVVSFVGYVTKEITVGSQKNYNIKLKSSQNNLNDVVIIGYQKVHKKNVNAAVATISSKQLEDIPVISVSSIISSLSTGIQTPTQSGAPGGRSALIVRGNTNVSGSVDGTGYSSPLYVVDGVQTSLEDLAGFNTSNSDFLASLNPNDIEKIDILKDASAAAIYGSRGANGVIIITTKKGSFLDKPEFTFSLNTGISPIPNLVPIYTGSAERNAKMAMIKRWWKSDYQQGVELPMVLSDSLNPAFNNKVDYQGMFYRTGISNKYNLSMKGGSEASNYRISLGYDNVEGVIQNSGYKRYTLNANLNSKVGENFTNQFITNLYQIENQTGQGNPDGTNFNFNSTLPSDPSNLNSSLFYVSDAKIKSLKGELSEKLNTDVTFSTTFSDFMKYDFSNAFSVNAQFNYVYSSQKRDFYEPSTVREEGDGLASYALYNRKNLSSDVYLNYYKKFNSHTVTAVFGQKTDYNEYENMNIYAQGFGVDAIKVINERYTKAQIGGSTSIESNALLSYFGRLGYRYKERYMVDFAFSRDGSSRFGQDVRYATFPSVSVGWVFSDEPFIKNLGSTIINYGKFRASYGINGKEIDNNYLRYGSYRLGYGGNPLWSNLMTVSTYGGVTGVTPDYNTIGNPNLTWVNSSQWDLGLDMDLFNNRINITFDAYNKKTDQLLFPVLFPAYSGFNKAEVNVVGVMNYGWEAMLKFKLFAPQNPWKLELSVGASHNENYVTALPNGNKDYYGEDNQYRKYGYVVGLPLNLPVVFKNEYILDNISQLPVNPYTGQVLHGKDAWGAIAPGAPVWKDYNGDYLLDEAGDYKLDTSFKATPDFTGLFNLNLKYKGWYMQAYSQFSFGSDIMDSSTQKYLDKYDNIGDWATTGLKDLSTLSFWEQPGDGAAGVRYPALYPTLPHQTAYYRFRPNQSLFNESGDYWKVTNASIGYTIERNRILDQMHISRVRVYGSIINPYQWQKSKVVTDASQVDEHGYTYGNGYPQSKTISFGLDVKF